MAQTKAQLIGGLGISTAQSLVVGSAATIHTGGFRIGASDLHSTGISLSNINATGIITASSFVGNVTGTVTGTAATANFATTSFALSGTPHITVGFATATEFDISGSSNSLSAGGINVGIATATTVRVGTAVTINSSGINVIGVITATSFVGNGSGLTGTGSTVADDTSTNSTFYPVLTQTTSGTITASKVSTTKLNFNPSTGIFTATQINDAGGNVRALANNAKTGSYVLAIGDVGELINITTGGVTVPSGVFSAGDSVTIYNNSSSPQTITQGGGVTLRLAGTTTTGNRTLDQRGITTVMCVASNEFVISGAGLS